eukprot:UN21208
MSYMGGVLTLILVSKMYLQAFFISTVFFKTNSLDCKPKDRTKSNKIGDEFFSMSSYIFYSCQNPISNIFHFYHWAQNMRSF